MTDQERLEKIEKCIKHDLVHNDGMMISVCYAEIRWLIEQAEQVQELEKERSEWKDTAQSYYMTNQELREQNKRYGEVINNINEKAMLYGVDEQVYEAIKEAIKALKGESE